MLQVKLSKIIEYAHQHESVMIKATEEFFGVKPIDLNEENIESISSLFNEWSVFDFKLQSGTTFLTEYYFKNPNELSKDILDELKQMIETQQFEMLEIESLKRGEWIQAYGLYSGKDYRIYEHSASLEIPNKGMFWGRVAKINGKYLLVGSNPMFIPVTNTQRSKKMYLENKPKSFSPKDVLPFFLPRKKSTLETTIEKDMTPKQIEDKRKILKRRFQTLQKQYRFNISFKKVSAFIYNENYKYNFADSITDIIKLGISEKIVSSHISLFQNLWNFLPHKKLQGMSPYEMHRKIYK